MVFIVVVFENLLLYYSYITLSKYRFIKKLKYINKNCSLWLSRKLTIIFDSEKCINFTIVCDHLFLSTIFYSLSMKNMKLVLNRKLYVLDGIFKIAILNYDAILKTVVALSREFFFFFFIL